MDEWMARLLEDAVRHRGKLIGTLLGLLVGWMVVEYGLIRALFVIACLAAGYLLGTQWDRGQGWRR